MSLTNEVGQTTKAIGRAFKGEPICLLVLEDRGAAALVAGANERTRRPIGYRKEWLYRFEPELFGKLREAWERGDSDALTALWAVSAHL